MEQTKIRPMTEQEKQEAARQKVIRSFIKDGVLVSLPVKQAKKQIVLEELVKSFDKDREYSEKEVNAIMRGFNEDFCTLRRELTDAKLMTRKDGVYRRV
ncbi:MAG TPA: DUF2087 domain-containing protein [Eubacteriales bacterium]|nr:DUF2087 domain-containing protein [Eubacteriales bacterium]